jgi:predicted ATPase
VQAHADHIRTITMPHRPLRRDLAILAALVAKSLAAEGSCAQVIVATHDSQLLASPISAMPTVDVARLRASGTCSAQNVAENVAKDASRKSRCFFPLTSTASSAPTHYQ